MSLTWSVVLEFLIFLEQLFLQNCLCAMSHRQRLKFVDIFGAKTLAGRHQRQKPESFVEMRPASDVISFCDVRGGRGQVSLELESDGETK